VLLSPIFVRDSHKKALKLFVIMVLMGAVVFWWVRVGNLNHPGQGVEFHLWDNLHFYARPNTWFEFMASHAPLIPFPKGLNLIFVWFVVAMLFFSWKSKPVLLKQVFWVACAVNLPLFVLFGFRDEMRNLSMLFPAMYFLATDSVMQLYASEFPVWTAQEHGDRNS
jgi:hypothetical protein